MDQKKKEAITGLLVGFVGLIFIFYFNFGKFEFCNFPKCSLIGDIIYDAFKNANNGTRDLSISTSTATKRALWIIQVFYILFFIQYRSCIGYWFYKLIRMVYKKI